MHRDHVTVVPDNNSWHILASTKVTPNQGMVKFTDTSVTPQSDWKLQDIHVWTVQAHPEFTEPIVTKIVEARYGTGKIDPDTKMDYATRQHQESDGVLLAKSIWRVLGVPEA